MRQSFSQNVQIVQSKREGNSNSQRKDQERNQLNETISSRLINKNLLENSILIKLRHSALQKPSFEQMMLLEHQKKQLWELLALKQQAIEKLQQKINCLEHQNQKYQCLLQQKACLITNLQQKQQTLQNQLKKASEIRKNIIQELNLLKKSLKQEKQHLFHQNLKNQNIQEKLNLTNRDLYSRKQTLYQQNSQLKNQNMYLKQKNQLLKQNLNQVLKELRQIKVNIVEKFNLSNFLNVALKQQSEKRGKDTSKNKENYNLNQNQILQDENFSFKKNVQNYAPFNFNKSKKNSLRKRNLSSIVSVRKNSMKKVKNESQNSQKKVTTSTQRKSLNKQVILLRQLPIR